MMKKSTLLILLFLTPLIAQCQNKQLSNPEACFSALIVSNMENSLHWYSDVLGFSVINKVTLKERGLSQANLKRGSVFIELIELSSAVPVDSLLKDRSSKTKIHGFFKFGFRVPDFDQWVNHLKKSKVRFRGNVVTDKVSGKKMVIVLDPDGNRIQFFEK